MVDMIRAEEARQIAASANPEEEHAEADTLAENAMGWATRNAMARTNTRVRMYAKYGRTSLAVKFAPGELDRIYLNFCDPWPATRHARRRLTHRDFLERYARALKPGGRIHFKTDNTDLFEFSINELEMTGWKLYDVTRDLHHDGPVGIMTGYEEKFHAQGVPICRLEAAYEG